MLKVLPKVKKSHIWQLLWAYISSATIDLITPLTCEWHAYKPYSWQPNFYIIPETQYWRNKFLYKSSQADFYNQRKTSLAFYILSTIWRLKMHKRQKDVREKKTKMYFFIMQHCGSFSLPLFHSHVRNAIKKCCMKPRINFLWLCHQLFKGLMGKAACCAPSRLQLHCSL